MRWLPRYGRKYHWHRWFAWRPVLVPVEVYLPYPQERWVWLEWVERRKQACLFEGFWWDYREIL
jgi:hypothetical protein